MKTLLFIFTLSSFSFAQMLEGDLLDALDGSGWGKDYQTKADGEAPAGTSDPVIDGNATSQDLNCNDEKERTTVPYKFLLGLLANKSLDISHDPHSATLNLDGGIMIGNCQSMLETIVSKPNASIPYYTFQVGVKRPGGCEGTSCSYDVTKIVNGDNVKIKKSFKPSFAGFVDCLKETGVFANGKIQEAKVAPVEFKHSERDISLTSELVYANRGFKGTRYAGKFSSNKIPDYPGCYYFEDIKKEGFKTYSVDDMEDYELERLYQKVCNSGNYKLIDSHISDFSQLLPFKHSLEDIRNELILDEVKRLHEIVSEAEDLSEVDKAKFKEVTSDFLEHVIKPLKTDLSNLQRLYANPGHSQKEKMLNSVFGPEKAKALLGKDPAELKDAIKDELDKKASLLVSYAREPYLTKDDYSKMASSKAGAPLDSSTWTSAVLDLYEVHNTAFNYGRYSNDFWESHYKDNPAYKNEKRYEAASKLDKKISSKMSEKRKSIKRVSDVAANPGVNRSANYAKTKARVLSDIDKKIAEYQRNLQTAQIKIRTQCAQEKQQKYWISQQACVRDAQEQYEACLKQIKALLEARESAVAKYDGLIEEENEARKAAGLEVSSSKTSSSTSSSSSKKGEFSFDPATTAQNMANNNQYSQQIAQLQAQMLQRQQLQSYTGNNYNSYFNTGYPNYNNGINLSLGLGANLGGNGYYTPYSGYRGPSGYYGGGYTGGYNPALQYYGGNYTGVGGTFNLGGYSGLPQGVQYGPAYSPMATQGGTTGGFSFGF